MINNLLGASGRYMDGDFIPGHDKMSKVLKSTQVNFMRYPAGLVEEAGAPATSKRESVSWGNFFNLFNLERLKEFCNENHDMKIVIVIPVRRFILNESHISFLSTLFANIVAVGLQDNIIGFCLGNEYWLDMNENGQRKWNITFNQYFLFVYKALKMLNDDSDYKRFLEAKKGRKAPFYITCIPHFRPQDYFYHNTFTAIDLPNIDVGVDEHYYYHQMSDSFNPNNMIDFKVRLSKVFKKNVKNVPLYVSEWGTHSNSDHRGSFTAVNVVRMFHSMILQNIDMASVFALRRGNYLPNALKGVDSQGRLYRNLSGIVYDEIADFLNEAQSNLTTYIDNRGWYVFQAEDKNKALISLKINYNFYELKTNPVLPNFNSMIDVNVRHLMPLDDPEGFNTTWVNEADTEHWRASGIVKKVKTIDPKEEGFYFIRQKVPYFDSSPKTTIIKEDDDVRGFFKRIGDFIKGLFS